MLGLRCKRNPRGLPPTTSGGSVTLKSPSGWTAMS